MCEVAEQRYYQQGLAVPLSASSLLQPAREAFTPDGKPITKNQEIGGRKVIGISPCLSVFRQEAGRWVIVPTRISLA